LIVIGGLTYSGGGDYPFLAILWWFGFDCAHLGDRENPKSLEYVEKECESLAKQLAEFCGKLRNRKIQISYE